MGRRQRFGLGLSIGSGKAGAALSFVAIVAVQVGAVAVIHGRVVDAQVLRLAVATHRATRASSGRTPPTAPFMLPSACGGMSGSCIHIFSLVNPRPGSQA